MSRKTRHLLILILGIVVLIFGVSRLNIQSVSEYQDESREIARQLQPEKVENTTPASITEKSVLSEKESEKPQKKEVTKKNKNRNKKENSLEETSKSPQKTPDVEKKHRKNQTSGKKSHKRGESAPVPTAKDKLPEEEKKNFTCSVEIRCDALAESSFDGKEELMQTLPKDGLILAETRVSVEKGATVYDLLTRICRAENIALDAVYTPMYGTYYIRGIAHLYEMDAGDMSGWLYTVNGEKPDIGASAYQLAAGDRVVWQYRCDGEL